MNKKILGLMLAMILGTSALAGCGKTEEAKEAEVKTEETKTEEKVENTDGELPKLIFIAGDMSNESQVFASKMFTEHAEEYGFEVSTLDGRGDPQIQAQVVGNAVAQGADVICVNPNDASGIAPSLEAAKNAGVIVGVYGSEIMSDTPEKARDFYVTQDDIQGGKLAVEAILEKYPSGCNVVEVEGQAGHDAAIKRHTGFTENLDGTGLNLLASMAPTQWATAEALSITEDMIVKYGDEIDAIFCHWDNGATGCIEALKAANMEDVVVIGIDGCQAGYNQVKAGDQYATISIDADKLVRGCMEVARKAINGEEYSAENLIAFDMITQNNIDEFPVPEW